MPHHPTPPGVLPEGMADLQTAVALLEAPSLTARITAVVGTPLESALRRLPQGARAKVEDIVRAALHKAADAALWSMDNTPETRASRWLHKGMAATSGAVGGAFGLAALALELPVSTTIMLRAIADVARSEGFDLADDQTRQACLEVFALGGPGQDDDGVESGYYACRVALAESVQFMGRELAAQVSGQASHVLAQLIERIAARLGVVITEKLALQAVPVVGALTGATLNVMFTDFYQDMARGHFIVRRLEKQHGEAAVRAAYQTLCRTPPPQGA